MSHDRDTYRARDAGQTLAQALANSLAPPTAPGFDWATCTGTPANKLLPVTLQDTAMNVPYTTNCAAAKTGDRILLLTVGHLTTAIAILTQ
ncbi:hypothetical protein [Bifidobacterium pseudolongum]|uniref:Uncharacterized protein n=1 Tax=Bifidobacterium pseudolongum subsp. globosum TaxID=1690 RepID=A0A4Q5ATN6_9BIFI|nr:hypothetical protein [Bifidobacterium pseudolongum]RYQ36623.1 hypothetical protein PG2003B_1122 [Bifidobacterium pseudolongum subsp. globosum]